MATVEFMFHRYGSNEDKLIKTETVSIGNTVEFPSPPNYDPDHPSSISKQVEGYTFIGWALGKNGIPNITEDFVIRGNYVEGNGTHAIWAIYNPAANSNKTKYQHRDILYTDVENNLQYMKYIVCSAGPPVQTRAVGDPDYSIDTSGYVKQIDKSYFLTVDDISTDMWTDTGTETRDKVTKPGAITKYISSSVWTTDTQNHYVPSCGAVSSLISDSVWSFTQATNGYVPTINAVQNLRTSNTNTARYNGAIPSSWYGDRTHFVTLDDISFLFGN